MDRSLNKLNLLIVVSVIGLSTACGYLYFQIQNAKGEVHNQESAAKPTETYYYGKGDEIIGENGDWQLISTIGTSLDYARGLYLKNTKDPNKLKILGTTDPFLFKFSAVFLDQGDRVLFIQTRLDEEKRLYPQKEKLVFYSISRDKVYKEIPREKFLGLLTKEDQDFASSGTNLANLKLSPDKKHAAINLTNLTEPSAWLFVINLENGKITAGPSALMHYDWKDNRTIEYDIRSGTNLDETGLPYPEKKTYSID